MMSAKSSVSPRLRIRSSTADHSFMLVNKQLFGWGSNYEGRLGFDTSDDSELHNTEIRLLPFFAEKPPIRLASAGSDMSLVVDSDGRLLSFGSEMTDQHGFERPYGTPPELPLEIPFFIGKFVDLVTCGNGCSFARADGLLYGWGSNMTGKLGHPVSVEEVKTPELVPGIDQRRCDRVFAGTHHHLFLVEGEVYTAGKNTHGQCLGPRTKSDYSLVTKVPYFQGMQFQDAALGYVWTAVLAGGEVHLFGTNFEGWLEQLVERYGPISTIGATNSILVIRTEKGSKVHVLDVNGGVPLELLADQDLSDAIVSCTCQKIMIRHGPKVFEFCIDRLGISLDLPENAEEVSFAPLSLDDAALVSVKSASKAD